MCSFKTAYRFDESTWCDTVLLGSEVPVWRHWQQLYKYIPHNSIKCTLVLFVPVDFWDLFALNENGSQDNSWQDKIQISCPHSSQIVRKHTFWVWKT